MLWLEKPWQSPQLPDSCPVHQGQKSQRDPRASIWRLPDCTHLVFTSTALPPDCRPVLLYGDTSPAPALPASHLPGTRRGPNLFPPLLKDGVTLNPIHLSDPFQKVPPCGSIAVTMGSSASSSWSPAPPASKAHHRQHPHPRVKGAAVSNSQELPGSSGAPPPAP